MQKGETRSTSRLVVDTSTEIAFCVEYRDDLERFGRRAVDHNETRKPGDGPETNRKRGYLGSFGAKQAEPAEGGTGSENRGFYAICRIWVVFGYVIPNVTKVFERVRGELISKRHPSGDSPFCPVLQKDLDRPIRVDEFATLGLREALGDMCGNGLSIGEHPVAIPILLVNDSESLVEHLFRAHSRVCCAI